MDSPMSAFAVYNKNKPKQIHVQKVKSPRRKKPMATNSKVDTKKPLKKDVKEELARTAAQKLKTSWSKRHAKEAKAIGKMKSHKKKKKAKELPKKTVAKPAEKKDETDSASITPSEDIPMLIPVTETDAENPLADMADDINSQASSGIEFIPIHSNSVTDGLRVFSWMIAPYNTREFFVRNWEKKPLHIARNKPDYYKDLLTTPMIDNMLRKENIQFTKNIDITSYVDEKRETHNPVGRAHPHVVWDYYLNGCSIRLLNPQTYLQKLHLMNATLQEFFCCFVGANAYLTPPDSQGFAPHYDDIEAFILQTEGKKLWKIYPPRSEKEKLPRVSSKNFEQDEIGEPMLEVTLEAGDMLFFPKGFIHQGVTIDGEHSLHLTISMYQKHSWADLLEKLVPAALQQAIQENVSFRQGLPFDIYDNFGLVNADISTPTKDILIRMIKSFILTMNDHLPIDEAVDEMAKLYQHDVLPPVLNDHEKAVTVFGDSDVMTRNGKVINRVELSLDTRIRLLRKNVLRMVMEPDGIKIYYCIENSLEYHGNDLQYLEVDEHLAPAVETLIISYPSYVFVENLDVPSEADKLQVANDLWERGLIMTEYPLETLEDE